MGERVHWKWCEVYPILTWTLHHGADPAVADLIAGVLGRGSHDVVGGENRRIITMAQISPMIGVPICMIITSAGDASVHIGHDSVT